MTRAKITTDTTPTTTGKRRTQKIAPMREQLRSTRNNTNLFATAEGLSFKDNKIFHILQEIIDGAPEITIITLNHSIGNILPRRHRLRIEIPEVGRHIINLPRKDPAEPQ